MCAKIRQGFVSNSSSSSFLIYGAGVRASDINFPAFKKTAIQSLENKPKIHEWDKKKLETLKSMSDNLSQEEVVDFIKENDGLSELLYSSGIELDVHTIEYEDAVYIGLNPTTIKDDETGREFKDRVESKIKSMFNVNKFEYIEDCSYNG